MICPKCKRSYATYEAYRGHTCRPDTAKKSTERIVPQKVKIKKK